MENMQYAEELVREFLVFRGFTNTLQVFEAELGTDIGKGFQVDKILDLIFSVYIPKFEAEKLVCLLSFFKKCFSSSSETVLITTLSKLEVSILRYYISHAIQSGRKDKVVELFDMNGNEFLKRDEDWTAWFAIPYIKNPNLDPEFRIYFSKEWYEALRLSVRNFFSEIFNGTRLPALLKISSEKNTANRLKKDIKQLNLKLSQLQALLEEKDAQLCRLRSNASSVSDGSTGKTNGSSSIVHVEDPLILRDNQEGYPLASPGLVGKMLDQDFVAGPSHVQSELTMPKYFHDSITSSVLSMADGETGDVSQIWQDGAYFENGKEVHLEDEFPEVKVDFQETFLGHTSPISRCRFSASGSNIASASVDGTVRIWTYDSSTPASRNATIYCGAEIMSLDWECKSDRLALLMEVLKHGMLMQRELSVISAQLKHFQGFSYIQYALDLLLCAHAYILMVLQCLGPEVQPCRTRFCVCSGIKGFGLCFTNCMEHENLEGCVLPLGKDPPAITSLCFNHNGKILAASATDGMIHMFDMAAGLQITGWPAHDSGISSILFGPDETSIFSLGSDGKN